MGPYNMNVHQGKIFRAMSDSQMNDKQSLSYWVVVQSMLWRVTHVTFSLVLHKAEVRGIY